MIKGSRKKRTGSAPLELPYGTVPYANHLNNIEVWQASLQMSRVTVCY